MNKLKLIKGQASSDGDGVELTRYIGTHELLQQDPFLLFDVFGSPDPKTHSGGFPPHPHRGFETLTYMLSGSMTHEDNQGHQDTVHAGGIQWMRAGSGIIHAETPVADNGHLWGTQLWINSPANKKMTSPQYAAHAHSEIPHIQLNGGISMHLIAGRNPWQRDSGHQGPLVNDDINLQYAHIKMPGNQSLGWDVPDHQQGFVYVIKGDVITSSVSVGTGQMLSFKQIRQLDFESQSDSEFLIVSGLAINEPIARRGPFVMNTQAELEQAFRDFRDGRFD